MACAGGQDQDENKNHRECRQCACHTGSSYRERPSVPFPRDLYERCSAPQRRLNFSIHVPSRTIHHNDSAESARTYVMSAAGSDLYSLKRLVQVAPTAAGNCTGLERPTKEDFPAFARRAEPAFPSAAKQPQCWRKIVIPMQNAWYPKSLLQAKRTQAKPCLREAPTIRGARLRQQVLAGISETVIQVGSRLRFPVCWRANMRGFPTTTSHPPEYACRSAQARGNRNGAGSVPRCELGQQTQVSGHATSDDSHLPRVC